MIKMYCVYDIPADRFGTPIDLNEEPMIAFCPTRKDCKEYIERYVRLKHMDHFRQWCSLRDKDFMDDRVFDEYAKDNVDEKYVIRRLRYRKSQLASMIRMLLGIVPMGCSFETEAERDYILNQMLTPEEAEEIQGIFDSEEESD